MGTFLLVGRRGGQLAAIPWSNPPAWQVAVLGATQDDPLSWVERSSSGSKVMLWTPGSPPRPLASLPITRTLPASHGSLPVVLVTAQTTLLRVLPFPLKGDPPVPAASEPLPLDGWTDVGKGETFLRTVPVCGAHPPATKVAIQWPRLTAEVAGAAEPPSHATLDLRVDAAGALPGGSAVGSTAHRGSGDAALLPHRGGPGERARGAGPLRRRGASRRVQARPPVRLRRPVQAAVFARAFAWWGALQGSPVSRDLLPGPSLWRPAPAG
jgi:hypothetical protein